MRPFLAAACLLAASILSARAADQPLRPKEPILPPMPARAAWMLEFEGAPRKAAGGADPETQPDPARNLITISRDGAVCRIVSEKSIGGNREVWIAGGNVFLVRKDGSRCALVDASAFPGADFSHGDFEYFHWLRLGNYAGLMDFEGRKAFVFEEDSLKRPLSARERASVAFARQSLSGTGELPDLSLDAAQKAPARPPREVSDADVLRELGWGETFRAWIDIATQRPLYLESGDLRVRVRYLPDPGSLTPPPSVLQRLTAIEKEKAALSRKPTRPGSR